MASPGLQLIAREEVPGRGRVPRLVHDEPSRADRRFNRITFVARTDSQSGLQGESSAWAPLLLAVLGFAASAVAAVYLYRRTTARSAYLLTTPPLIVFTILVAETASRLLPSWM